MMPSPSQSPIAPPSLARASEKEKTGKLVVVTRIVSKNVMSMSEPSSIMLTSSSFATVDVVVQGTGQSETDVPSKMHS